MLHRALVPAFALPALLACSGAPDGIDETAARGGRGDEAAATADADTRQPTSRVPFLDGAFVTWSGAMPVDVEQAIAGERTDHPVVVWAGLDDVHADRTEGSSAGHDAQLVAPR